MDYLLRALALTIRLQRFGTLLLSSSTVSHSSLSTQYITHWVFEQVDMLSIGKWANGPVRACWINIAHSKVVLITCLQSQRYDLQLGDHPQMRRTSYANLGIDVVQSLLRSKS